MEHFLPLRHGSISLGLEQQWLCEKKGSLAGEMEVFCTLEYAAWPWLLLCITILG